MKKFRLTFVEGSKVTVEVEANSRDDAEEKIENEEYTQISRQDLASFDYFDDMEEIDD